MEGKDKLIGTVLIITGLFLVAIGVMTAMKVNNASVVNPYADVEVYEEHQVQEEQSLEPTNTETEETNEQVDVYFEEEITNTTTDENESITEEDEGSTRYIY